MKNSLKTSLLTLVLLLGVTSIQPTEVTPEPETTHFEASAPIFGAKRYNKRRIQRQNTPDKINQRNKRLLRKNGLAQVEQVVIWKGGENA